MKEKLKKTWDGFISELKTGSDRAILGATIVLALPSFLYSIIGTLVFGLYITGWSDLPLLVIIMLAPSGLGLGYLFVKNIIIALPLLAYRSLTKKKKK